MSRSRRRIDSPIVGGLHLVGKWFCSESAMGSDGHVVHRYLQEDGTWGKTTFYFDSEEQLLAAEQLGHQPDFTLSEREAQDRALIRDDVERMFEEDFED